MSEQKANTNVGRSVLRTFQNLRLWPADETTLALDATRKAGAATDLALRIRRHGRLSFDRVQAFARFAALSAFDLRTWCLPAMRQEGLIDFTSNESGDLSTIEEQIGVAAPVLEQAAQLWISFRPTPLEQCAIDSAELAALTPLSKTDHQQTLESAGHNPEQHERAFAVLRAIGVLRSQRSPALGEDVLYSPYVWSSEVVQVAVFLHELPTAEREQLAALAGQTAARPGVPFERLGGDGALLQGARKVGLIDGTRVLTTGAERGFAFPPGLEHQLAPGGKTDITHERKLFVAHILNGYYFGRPSTGRINNPIALVSAMINKGAVGPTTAAKTDYLLLESAGIVKTHPVGSHMAQLELVKNDVAQDSLDLIRLAVADEEFSGNANSVEALWLPGSYTTPEKDRRILPETTGAQHEVLVSVVDELRESLHERLRDEDLLS